MPSSPDVPTKAQAELMRYMVEVEEGAGTMVRMTSHGRLWRGGDLIDYYRARRLRETGIDVGSHSLTLMAMHETAGSPRTHAWRRAGGTALKNLAGRGWVEFVHWVHGVPEYELTDAGRDAERRYRIVPGEVRKRGHLMGWLLVHEHEAGPRWRVSGNDFPDNMQTEIRYAGELREYPVVPPEDYPKTFACWPWHFVPTPAAYAADRS